MWRMSQRPLNKCSECGLTLCLCGHKKDNSPVQLDGIYYMPLSDRYLPLVDQIPPTPTVKPPKKKC